MREKDGFIELSKFIEHNPDVFIVVNTPAGATQFLVKYGNILAHVAMVMKRDLIMVWPINRQRDSVELLADFVGGSTGFSAIYVFKNAYFGAEYKFSIYDNSKIKARVTATLMFPELDDMIADALAGKRLAPSMAPPDFGITDHYILDVYRREAAEVLKVLHE